MARLLVSDYYQAYKFAVAIDPPANNYLVGVNAGFNMITVPEISAEAAEYREGTFTWTKKQMGVPTVSDATFQQGITSIFQGGHGAPFLAWMLAALEGSEYRAELHIWHLHRKDALSGTQATYTSRSLTIYEAFPIRVKPEGDLDATSSEVSIRELDVACEKIDYGPDFQDIKVPGTS